MNARGSTMYGDIDFNVEFLYSSYNNDVIVGTIASQIISLTIVYSTVHSDAYQRKHQSSASLAFVRGIRRGPVNSPHKWPVTRKMFPCDDVIMKYCIHRAITRELKWWYTVQCRYNAVSFLTYSQKTPHSSSVKILDFILCRNRLNCRQFDWQNNVISSGRAVADPLVRFWMPPGTTPANGHFL